MNLRDLGTDTASPRHRRCEEQSGVALPSGAAVQSDNIGHGISFSWVKIDRRAAGTLALVSVCLELWPIGV